MTISPSSCMSKQGIVQDKSYSKCTFTLFNKANEPEYYTCPELPSYHGRRYKSLQLRNKTATLTRSRKGHPKITKEKK